MKKIILVFFFFITLSAFLPRSTWAWLDCPYGKINDPFPGSCEFYIDTNDNQICDHSEPAPETIKETMIVQEEKEENRGQQLSFYFIFIPLAAYFIHWYLVTKTKISRKFKWLNRITFRYFWNLVLLLTFLPTAISGLLFILRIRNTFLFSLHNQLGIVFVVVGLLHFFARFQHFLKRP